MRTVSIEDARARLGDLVDRARIAGESTVITRYGKPVAVLNPYADEPSSDATVPPEGQNDR